MNFELVLGFDCDDPMFARGAEIGMLYQRLLTEAPPVVALIHATNAEMAMRLAESRGVQVSGNECVPGWLEVVFASSE